MTPLGRLSRHRHAKRTGAAHSRSIPANGARRHTQDLAFPLVKDANEVVTAYWAAANARDWRVFGDLLAEDVVYEGPQTRERVRGRANYVRFNLEGFPGAWHLVIIQIIGEGLYASSWIEFTNADGSIQPGLCFFELQEDGRIARITDFWPDPYELPANRAHLVERY